MILKATVSMLVISSFLGALFFTTGVLQAAIQVFSFVLLSFVLLWFLSSLFGERTPIITRYALLMGAENSHAEKSYTRKVTWIWSIFLMLLCGFKLSYLLAGYDFLAFGRVELVFYFGSVILFVIEFYFRQLLLPIHRGSSFFLFLRQLVLVSFIDVWNFDNSHSFKK